MSYAAIQDLIDAFGEDELVRATTPDGAEFGAVDAARAQARLDEASGIMDSYFRRRYVVPVGVVGPEIVGCCRDIARKLLHQTGSTQPSNQMVAAAKDRFDWLAKIADGRVTLDGVEIAGPLSGARTQDRRHPMRLPGHGVGGYGGDGFGRGGW